jgi:hypothetical protein
MREPSSVRPTRAFRQAPNFLLRKGWIFPASALAIAALVFVSCSGSSSTMSPTTGTIHVTLTDPPSCAFPNGNFDHVYVTIRSVQAHTSSSATDSTSGWQELAPQLNSQPMQIDLFSTASNTCLLTNLGSNTALPAGSYQQIRLLLVPNDGSGGATPSSNACSNQGWNCVVLHDSSVHELQLSSQANTGIKIPPGQIVGGPIVVNAGQDVDLNIDFNACASILQQGNGEYRLKPVLTAGQVSTNTTGISGKVLDSLTGLPVVGGTVLVALEKTDSTGADVIFQQTAADSSGMFNFCPLPAGASFDVVAVAINGAGVAYNATIVTGVPGGTNLGNLTIIPETVPSTAPATLQGFVTGTGAIDAAVTAQQTISLNGGGTRAVAIPAESGSLSNISVQDGSTCPSGAPANSLCAQYTLVVPPSNPQVGFFSSGAVTFTPPAAGNVLYGVRADAFIPLSGGTPSCSPATQTTALDTNGNPLQVTGGTNTVPQRLDFTGCS